MTFHPFRKKEVPSLAAFKRIYSSRTNAESKKEALQDSNLGKMKGTDLTKV